MGPGPASSSETIGQRLKRLRLERGFSQRELAAPGVSYAYISRIEAGTRQPSVKALRRLAAKLNVTPEYLETGSDLDAAEERELRLADAELALRLGDAAAGEPTIREILEEAVRSGDIANAARARVALGFLAYDRGEHKVALRLFEEAIATEQPPASERLDVYVTLARAYDYAGVPDRGVALLERCLDEVRQTQPVDVPAEVRYATTLSYLLSDSGDLDRARDVLEVALDRSREGAEDPYMRVRLYWSMARLSEMQGRSAAALHHMRRAMALLEATDDVVHLARGHLMCAMIMVSTGNGESALTQLDEAERLFGAHAAADDVGMLKRERARALALVGRAEDSVVLARESVALFDGRNEPELGSACSALGDALSATGDYDEAAAAYRKAVALLEDQSRWREAAQACQSWAKMLRRAGREQEALDVLERASELGLRLTPTSSRTR